MVSSTSRWRTREGHERTRNQPCSSILAVLSVSSGGPCRANSTNDDRLSCCPPPLLLALQLSLTGPLSTILLPSALFPASSDSLQMLDGGQANGCWSGGFDRSRVVNSNSQPFTWYESSIGTGDSRKFEAVVCPRNSRSTSAVVYPLSGGCALCTCHSVPIPSSSSLSTARPSNLSPKSMHDETPLEVQPSHSLLTSLRLRFHFFFASHTRTPEVSRRRGQIERRFVHQGRSANDQREKPFITRIAPVDPCSNATHSIHHTQPNRMHMHYT